MTIADFIAHLFEIKSIDIINAILIPGSIGLLLSFAVARYLIFTQSIQTAVTEVHRLNLLQYGVDDPDAQKMLIREITLRVSAVSVSLRTEGHLNASMQIRSAADHYRKLLVDAADHFANTPPDVSIAWMREILTNYAGRLLSLNPNYGALFDVRRFYSDVAITCDCRLTEFKNVKPMKTRTEV